MKKILLLLAMFLSFATQAQDFTPTNWVSDLGNFYTPEQEANLNSTISAYEKKTSIEIGVITIDSLGDNSIEQFALDQFNRLGIGKKGADNGILIVFSMKDRKSRIEVGNGMEAFFTDGDAYDALQVVKPHFRAGDYATGTSECINFITNKLGNQAFANKVAWLKEKQAKEAKQKAASIAAFKSGVIKFLLIASFFGALVFIYFLDKKRREKIAAEKERLRLEAEREATRIRKENERVERVKQNISQTEKYLKSVSVNRPTTENSKLLSSSFSSVTSFISSMVIEKGNMDNDQYIEALLRIKSTLDSKIEAYNELNSEYRTNISKYSDLDSLVNEAHSYNKKAISSLERIKQYGYNKDYKDLTSNIDSLLESKTAIEALFLTDVDKAISDAKSFRNSIDYLKSKSSDVTAYLNEIESAKSKVNSAESLFTSGLSNLNRYQKWMKPGEVDRVKSEFEKFKTKSNSSNDFLGLILIFAGVMTAVSALESTLSGRKSKEEEEERAEQRRLAAIAAAAEAERRRKRRQEEEEDDRRRRNSYSSYSSYSSGSSSSSDSGSSWGGFDGGSSSGGGSSDSW
jgi:uncharacterized membrane protein YgcG